MTVEAAEQDKDTPTGVGGGQHTRKTIEDAKRWLERYRQRNSILKIAREEGVDPGTISSWIRKLGVEIKQGQHYVEQPTLRLSKSLVDLLAEGPQSVLKRVEEGTWGMQATADGAEQLRKFCRFVDLHNSGLGVAEMSKQLGIHRSTVAEWRNGTDEPYLIKLALQSVKTPVKAGWRWLPLEISSGGNTQQNWICVPTAISLFDDVVAVIQQTVPLDLAMRSLERLGIAREMTKSMRVDLFAYVLGFLIGDAGKRGGRLSRVSSMNIDLQLIKSKSSNEQLGDFVSNCVGLLGIEMHRVRDKPPSGDQLDSLKPSYAYRWISRRSPLIGWMFQVCLGLDWGQITSIHQVKMDWVLESPPEFRKRLVQGLADSDGTVRAYTAEIASMPNAELVTRVLRSLGLTTAHTIRESGAPTRSVLSITDAAKLPLFNEYTGGYRYLRLISNARQRQA